MAGTSDPEGLDLKAELDGIFSGPLSEFVPRRNQLAASLAAVQRDEDAARVGSLGKPSISAWTVNQLHFRQADGMEALFVAGAALRHAQGAALEGKGAEALQEAQAEKRRVLRELDEAARAILLDAGHAASPSTLQRVAATLDALVTSAEPEVRPGRLSVDLTDDGVDSLTALAASLATPERKKSEPADAERRRATAIREATSALADARRRCEALSEQLVVVEGQRRTAANRLGTARAAFDAAQSEHDNTAEQASELEAELRAARAQSIRLEKVLSRLADET